MAYRVGLGEDIHRLEAGRPLILSGVEVPFEKGLVGHSDGDAVYHAVSDALLSSVGERDIGFFFSPNNPDIKGINSEKILALAKEKVLEAGYHVANLSIVITAERPKLAPYLDQFKANLSRILEIPAKDIGITCKTNEGLGPLGENLGIACHAVTLVEDVQ